MSEPRGRRVDRGWPMAERLRTLICLYWGLLLMVSVTAVGSVRLQSDDISRLTQIQAPAAEANDQVRQTITDAQTGLSGYELSGNRALLEPYLKAHDRTNALLGVVHDKLVLAAADAADGADTALAKDLEDRQRIAADQWWVWALSAEQRVSRGERTDPIAGRAILDRFQAANAALGDHLKAERDRARLEAGTATSRALTVSIAAALLAVAAMLLLGRRLVRSISRPLTQLRDTVSGRPRSERAREDRGSLEIRSIAGAVNALNEQNLGLLRDQVRTVAMHELAMKIENSVRGVPDTRQALGLLCAALGEGLGADRVLAHTIDAQHKELLGAQWHLPGLPDLVEMSPELLRHLGSLALDLRLTTGVKARGDFLAPDLQSQERNQLFYRETGARAVIMAPIGLNDRIIGMIFVLMVDAPRAWSETEANVVRQIAAFVAGITVETEYWAHQSEHVKRLELLDRQKSDFLATVSHELRTPLTSISGYLEMLHDGDAGQLTVAQGGMLDVVDRNTTRLTSLIEDLLVLNRIETGEIDDHSTGLSMSQLVIRACLEVSSLARKSAVELDVDAGLESVLVDGDRGSLERAIVNLLSNAIKFSPGGGVVSIRCTLDPSRSRVLVCVQDRGIGIPADEQLHMFTRFYRARNATDQAIPGTGLGLSIVKQIVDDHGGRLRLTSVEGEGTTVVMDLPLAGPDPAPVGGGNDSQPNDVFGIRA
jgi:two-component system, OmpR family, phosphate regulon sensor histidine kinase PhoR